MADPNAISKLVQKTVAEVLEARLHELKEEVARKVSETLEPALAGLQGAAKTYTPGSAPTDLLNAAVHSIYDNPGQVDILRSLLDGVSQFTARSALFVAKGGNLSGWQSRGFENEGAIKGFALNGSSGLAGRAMQDKEPVSAAAAEFDSGFISTHGNPSDGNASVHPLVVRDKVAAVIYTDGGRSGESDQSAVKVLVRSAASWLEILALRKASGAAGMESSVPEAMASAAATPAATPPAPAIPEPPPLAVHEEKKAAEPASGLSAEDQEVHKKAKRFAKLLVDEIKLYNQAKVTEGRLSKDLYARLKEDIDKSRATYEKRYGSTAAGSAGYFSSEVIRILADNDPSVLGDGFQ